MIAFDVPIDADPDAIRRALSHCDEAMRVERREGRVRLIVDEDDVATHSAAWLRTGLGRPYPWRWPGAEEVAGGAVRAGRAWWSIGRVRVAAPSSIPHALLLLAPVHAGQVARAIAGSLRPRPWEIWPRTEPRPLARTCARILQRSDAVARVTALALCTGPTAAQARALLRRSRRAVPRRECYGERDPDRAWTEIVRPTRGVWRLLSELEAWWR